MAVGDAHVFRGFLTPVLTQISFQSHQLLFSHASAEVRGGNTPERNFASTRGGNTLERNFASTRGRTHNHQVMSPTCSPLSHPGGAEKISQFEKSTCMKFSIMDSVLEIHASVHHDAMDLFTICSNDDWNKTWSIYGSDFIYMYIHK